MRKSLTIAGAALTAAHGVAHGTDSADHNASLTDLALKDASFSVTLSAPLNINAVNMYASHVSHSSHSSHASHASHSSGSGGSYRAAPIYAPGYPPASSSPTQAPSSAPSTAPGNGPSVAPLMSSPTSRPSTDQLKIMIMRVQAALYSKGYDPGTIDGELTAQTKLALAEFQAAHGLPVNSKMTTETLNALGVALTP